MTVTNRTLTGWDFCYLAQNCGERIWNLEIFTMVIAPADACRFIKSYQQFLESIADPDEVAGKSIIEKLVFARRRYLADRSLFAAWRENHADHDTDILDAIERLEIGSWVYLKDTRSYSVFLAVEGDSAYAVSGLTDRVRKIIGHSGVVVNCGVFPLGNCYVCDGLLENAVTLGRNYMSSFTQTYQSLRQSGGFHVSPKRTG